MEKIYAIRDSKSESFGSILLYKNNAEAIRSLQDAMENKQQLISKYPEDFALFCLGEYDKETAKISLLSQNAHIVNLLDIKKELN